MKVKKQAEENFESEETDEFDESELGLEDDEDEPKDTNPDDDTW